MAAIPLTHNSRWDLTSQTAHGGQEWRELSNFLEDYSVTTNALGTPKAALDAARDAIDTICHYPAADGDPAWTSLARFLLEENGAPLTSTSISAMKKRLLLGNGASELIDLCIRLTPGTSWRPGPAMAQYKEYARAAKNSGKKELPFSDLNADLLSIVNPCNPTGDFIPLANLKRGIETDWNVRPGTTVVIDESMQPWLGPHWRQESLISQGEWIARIAQDKGVKVFVIHSWTKLWCCTGLRVGSILAPTLEDAHRLRSHQVPWSMNAAAIAFLDAVVRDSEYLDKTWKLTPEWRAELCSAITRDHPDWTLHGEAFLSYVWIDTKNNDIARKCVEVCRSRGVPIRHGMPGYEKPTFIRLAVRHPNTMPVLLSALQDATKDV